MKCPRDHSVLAFSDEGRHPCNKCPQCHGLLLDEHEVGAVLSRAGRSAPAGERLAALPQASVRCPRDGATMRTLAQDGVELDLCPECRSLWLDAGELEKIRKRGRKGTARAAAVAGAALAGAATVAAAEPARSSLASGAAELVGEVAAEGVIEIAFELLAEGLGALLS